MLLHSMMYIGWLINEISFTWQIKISGGIQLILSSYLSPEFFFNNSNRIY